VPDALVAVLLRRRRGGAAIRRVRGGRAKAGPRVVDELLTPDAGEVAPT